MSKFTSGKWHLDPLTGEVRASGELIAKVYGATVFNKSRRVDESMANARLILGAPEMYTALQTALDELLNYAPSGKTAQKIRAILREVEGG